MSATPGKPSDPEGALSKWMPSETGRAQGVIAWSSFCFVLLQSVCTFFAALDGLRLLIGAGSLASIVAAGTAWDKLHADWIRVPMIGLGFAGSLLNLIVLAHIRHLRNRPASQWRRQPLTPRKTRIERLQLVLSLVTLGLIVIEEITHFQTFHHF